jgi:hypothetical protein
LPSRDDQRPAGREAAPDVLNIELSDLDEPAAPEGFSDVDLPPVTREQARAAAGQVVIPCLCSATGEPFEVAFVESKPGVFLAASAARATAKTAPTGPAGLSHVPGSFETPPQFQCPCCGAPALALHDACQTVMCIGNPRNLKATCPGCGAKLGGAEGLAASVPGSAPGAKKKGWR